MTREEAIEQLQDAKIGYKEYLSNDALDMAIKALEQEPRKAIWIERFDIPRGCGEYLCSNCMDEYGTDLLYAYCPNCGAYHGKNKETIKEEDFDKGRNQKAMHDTKKEVAIKPYINYFH